MTVFYWIVVVNYLHGQFLTWFCPLYNIFISNFQVFPFLFFFFQADTSRTFIETAFLRSFFALGDRTSSTVYILCSPKVNVRY